MSLRNTHVIASMSHMLYLITFSIFTPPLAVIIGLLLSLGTSFFSSCMLDALFVEEFFFIPWFLTLKNKTKKFLRIRVNMLLMNNNVGVNISARYNALRHGRVLWQDITVFNWLIRMISERRLSIMRNIMVGIVGKAIIMNVLNVKGIVCDLFAWLFWHVSLVWVLVRNTVRWLVITHYNFIKKLYSKICIFYADSGLGSYFMRFIDTT